LRALRCRVEGRVQRVGFRRYVLEAARRLKVSGYVRNELDDSVTIFAQGDEEVLQKLIEAVKSPRHQLKWSLLRWSKLSLSLR
jgi:acylphosphatase